MLSFNPDEYRQRLNTALGIRDTSQIGLGGSGPGRGPAQIENPYDTEEMQQPSPQQNLEAAEQKPAAPSGNLLPDMGGGLPGMGGSGEIPGMIDESGATGAPPVRSKADGGFSLPTNEDGKIQTRPPDLEAEVDPDKLGKAKTIEDVFDAASPKTQNAYMDWWEKSYGDINGKYDAMRKQLGEYKEFPDKPSKKQMFGMLLAYGARMMTNMRVGREGGSSDIDPMAASADAYEFGNDAVMGNRLSRGEHKQNLGAIESARAKELKELGTRGEAMNKASEIALRDAQRENLGKNGERFTASDGLVWMLSKDGNAVPVNDPKTGKQLKGPQNLGAGGSRNEAVETEKYRYDEYMRIHGVDAAGKKLTGEKLRKAEAAARNHARYGTMPKDEGTNLDDLRVQAKERVDTIIRAGGQDLFRGVEPEDIPAVTARMEEQEFERLKRSNLGSSPIHDGPRARAPSRSEEFVKGHPEALADFVADYGYVPEGMEQHVTPEIKQRMGL